MHLSTRRSFLSTVAAATAAGPLARAATRPVEAAEPQRVLVLGGTGFLGPHFVRAAMQRGHKVTLFNRGKTNPGLFADLEQLHGDREKGELDALKGRTFDAIVDTSGYVPAHVEATARMFADSARHYQFISSISVYRWFGERSEVIDEGGEVAIVEADKVASVSTIRASMPFYGALKARCEAAAEAAMPGKVANLRPGLIVGPGDPTDRFTWWPVRVDQGGEIMAPGDPDGAIQVVDVRDLADWMVHCIENGVVGVHNAVGFAGPVSMAEFLGGCKCATPTSATLTWVSEEFLQANDVGPWMEMPLWIPREGRSIAANQKAIAAGLRFRPLAATIADTLQWAKSERADRPFARTGVKPDKEKALLRKWRESRK